MLSSISNHFHWVQRYKAYSVIVFAPLISRVEMSIRVGRAGPTRARLWLGTFWPVRLTGWATVPHPRPKHGLHIVVSCRAGPQPVKARRALTGWEEK
jgi:hypothetical protein